jgi:hypothetical protein
MHQCNVKIYSRHKKAHNQFIKKNKHTKKNDLSKRISESQEHKTNVGRHTFNMYGALMWSTETKPCLRGTCCQPTHPRSNPLHTHNHPPHACIPTYRSLACWRGASPAADPEWAGPLVRLIVLYNLLSFLYNKWAAVLSAPLFHRRDQGSNPSIYMDACTFSNLKQISKPSKF